MCGIIYIVKKKEILALRDSEEITVEECITPLFFALSISPDKRGYRYLKSAVLFYDESKGSMAKINERVASKYNCVSTSVEKDMRSALKVSEKSEWQSRFVSLIGFPAERGKTIPVKRFVAIMSEYLSLERNREKVFALKTY